MSNSCLRSLSNTAILALLTLSTFNVIAKSDDVSVASVDLCADYKPSTLFTKTRSEIDQQIEAFANRKVIAEQADAFLSKLITAKSPVVTSWMNRRELADKPEEVIVKEWRSYYAKNFILMEYPNRDAKISEEMEKLVDNVLTTHLTTPFVSRLEKLFEKSKVEAIEAVKAMEIGQKDQILQRISGIKLYWPKSLKTARNNKLPLDLIDWGIAYDPLANEINVGVNALSYPNDETYLAVFAHEIGHSFDSCRWGAFFKEAWPFEKVGECLRSSKSVGAKKRDDSEIEKWAVAQKVPADLVLSLKQNPTCNRLIYPPAGKQADQLPESFADWFSAEVMARMSGVNFKKLRLDLCESKTLMPGSSYVSHSDRLRLIYLAQPKIAGKESAGRYCAIK